MTPTVVAIPVVVFASVLVLFLVVHMLNLCV
jgi:hypothetical protein